MQILVAPPALNHLAWGDAPGTSSLHAWRALKARFINSRGDLPATLLPAQKFFGRFYEIQCEWRAMPSSNGLRGVEL